MWPLTTSIYAFLSILLLEVTVIVCRGLGHGASRIPRTHWSVTPSRSSGTNELSTQFFRGDLTDDTTDGYVGIECIENLVLAIKLCSSLIVTGSIAMRASFDSSAEDDEVELIDIPSCHCTLPMGFHHSESSSTLLRTISS